MHNGKSRPVAEEIARYQRELMELYTQNTVPVANQPSPPPPAATEPPLPLPTPSLPPDPQANNPPPIEESPFVGYLRVFVFTANGAEPLQDARITVSRPVEGDEELYANTQTDGDGFTPVIPLPTVDPAFSLRPDGPQSFVSYDIAVTAEGFRPVRHENVPIYGNNYVTQPISLVPLLPGEASDDTAIFQSGGPADL